MCSEKNAGLCGIFVQKEVAHFKFDEGWCHLSLIEHDFTSEPMDSFNPVLSEAEQSGSVEQLGCTSPPSFVSLTMTTDQSICSHSRRKSHRECRRQRPCHRLRSTSAWLEQDHTFQLREPSIVSVSTPSTRSLDFGPPWISESCHSSDPTLVSSLMPYRPYQSPIPRPLERPKNQLPQTYQRTNQGLCERHQVRRTAGTQPRLSQDESTSRAILSSQCNSTMHPFGETCNANVVTQNTTSENVAHNIQRRLSSPLPSPILDSQSESSNMSSSSVTTSDESSVPLGDLPVYVVFDPSSAVSNTAANEAMASPGFNCHISMDAKQNSFTVNLRFNFQEECNEESNNCDRFCCDRQKQLCTDKANIKDAVFILYDLRMLSIRMPVMSRHSAQALQVANQLIRHAREFKTPDERSLWCPDCGQLPDLPVTMQCGHTRCTGCIQGHRACPCGTPAPKNLHVNTLIQDLIKKMLPNKINYRSTESLCGGFQVNGPKNPLRLSQVRTRRAAGFSSQRGCARRWQGSPSSDDLPPSTPLSPEARVAHARRLAGAGRLHGAALHLARAAASAAPLARLSRLLLLQTISAAAASEGGDARRLARGLLRGVRAQAARAWLSAADLECVLCYHVYTRPVTTPCGHTYCRTCIERSMDYRKCCALCQRPLHDFDLAATRETVFISAALAAIDALSPLLPPDPDVIPIFVCTVAYPAIPCPLFIFDPRYWMMIRRVLESGSRKFGMVAYERDRTYSDFGTVLEVRDCVHLEDGRSILSTVGVSRFRVIERDVRDGCDVARIQPLTDIAPTEELVVWELRLMATQIWYKAIVWLDGMGRGVRSEIEAAFGRLPAFERAGPEWWASADGPAWLWWLIAILPLRSEIKILILSTRSLLKRVMAVSRTLEAIDQVAMTATATAECDLHSALNNAAEWLERGA